MTESCNPLISRAASIMKASTTATIATVDENGFPSASAISSIRTSGIENAWFVTGLSAGKTKRLLKNNKCSLCYCDGDNNVTLRGTAEVLTDPDAKRDLWDDRFTRHFSEGAEDPEYCVLKFTAVKAVLYVDSQSEEFDFGNAV